jgi:hypothetical protein
LLRGGKPLTIIPLGVDAVLVAMLEAKLNKKGTSFCVVFCDCCVFVGIGSRFIPAVDVVDEELADAKAEAEAEAEADVESEVDAEAEVDLGRAGKSASKL